MGSSGNPSLLAMVIGFVCFIPILVLFWMALADYTPKQRRQQYREIPGRDLGNADERAGFVQAKLEKIERASR